MYNPNVHQFMMCVYQLVIYIYIFYSGIKRNEVLLHVITWLNINTLLTERSQMPKIIVHLHELSRIDKSTETKP